MGPPPPPPMPGTPGSTKGGLGFKSGKGMGNSPPGTPPGFGKSKGMSTSPGPSMGKGLPPMPATNTLAISNKVSPEESGGWEQRVPLTKAPDGVEGGVGGRTQFGGRKNMKTVQALRYLSPRAVIQIFLTVLCLGTSLTAFIFSIFFNESLTVALMENQSGQLKSQILPCIRSVLPVCGNDVDDQCWDRCCPPGFICQRSPVVGLYCQDGNNVCGGGNQINFAWCNDYADIPKACQTEVCIKRDLVHRISIPTFTVAGIAVFLDLVDMVIFFAAPDSVQFKAGVNLMSSSLKWTAFGLLLGGGSQTFVSDLYDKQCYNNVGMQEVRITGQHLVSFVTTCVISALLSLILAPISAFYGGKLIGVPYVR